MKAEKLYAIIDGDFKVDGIGAEDWNLDAVSAYVTPSFVRRNEGIMYDFSKEVSKVFTMTFPDPGLIAGILEQGEGNALVFSHHAQNWVSEERDGGPYIAMENLSGELLARMKAENLGLYSLHIPLDNFGPYSTCSRFAEALSVRVLEPCAPYLGAMTGIIGETEMDDVRDLAATIENTLGHRCSLYSYGDPRIKNAKVGIVTGWGLELDVLEEMREKGIQTYITGFTRELPKSEGLTAAHAFAKAHGINLLGTTHYTSEKYACMAMTEYFEHMGIEARFIEGRHHPYDL